MKGLGEWVHPLPPGPVGRPQAARTAAGLGGLALLDATVATGQNSIGSSLWIIRAGGWTSQGRLFSGLE